MGYYSYLYIVMMRDMNIEYKITEIEDPITKDELKVLKKFLGEFTLKTNAGLDIHSSEVKGGKWNGITLKRL